MRILIVKLSSIGDVIHTLPTLSVIKKALPEAEISWAVEKRAAEILRDNPLLNRLIEVDTKAALDDLPDPSSYFQRKTEQLLTNGVKKVIWIYTASQKVMVAEQNKPWSIDAWNKDLKIFQDIYINIQQLLKEV